MVSLRKSISLRLLRYVFGCYIIVTLLVTSMQLLFEYNHVKEDIFSELDQLEQSFTGTIAASIWDFNLIQLNSTLSGINHIESVSGVKILDDQNTLISSVGDTAKDSSDITSTQQTSQPHIKSIEINKNGETQTLFEYQFKIQYDDQSNVSLLGYGYIYVDQETIINDVKYSCILIIINATIKTLALWVIFLIFSYKVVARPLGTLTKVTMMLNPNNPTTLKNDGSLDDILRAGHEDELYLLATKFNQMRDAVLHKMDIIEAHNKELDMRIKERTEALTASNSTLQQVNSELKHLSLHDPLTELPNRVLFNDRLALLLKLAVRERTEFIVLVIDLQKFKSINDDYGHQIGDKVLKETALRLSTALRESDTLARMGGDEFAAILPNINISDGKKLVARLLDSSSVFRNRRHPWYEMSC